MARNFSNTEVAHLTADEYKREAELLLPVQLSQMRRLFTASIAGAIASAEDGKTLGLGAVHEGTRLYPIRNWWWYSTNNEPRPPLAPSGSKFKIPDRAYFICREDTILAGKSIRITEDAIYPVGTVTASGEAQATASFTVDQLHLVKDCCDELVRSKKQHDLQMINLTTVETAYSIIDPPLDWRPLDWH